MKRVIVELFIATDADDDRIKTAVEKGIYIGCDLRGVAAPQDIKEINTTVTEILKSED